MSFQTDLYDSMLQNVMDLTARPDLDAETKIALRAATTNAHLTDAYFRDCVTTYVQIPNAAAQVSLNLSTLFPNFRGITGVRPADVNGNLIDTRDVSKIEVVELGDIYDPEYGTLKNNIAYVSGDSLVIRSPLNVNGFVVSYLKAPQVRRELYDSWIAQMMPTVIELWAAAIVFSTDGNDEKSRNYLTQIEKFYIPQLKSNFLVAVQR